MIPEQQIIPIGTPLRCPRCARPTRFGGVEYHEPVTHREAGFVYTVPALPIRILVKCGCVLTAEDYEVYVMPQGDSIAAWIDSAGFSPSQPPATATQIRVEGPPE